MIEIRNACIATFGSENRVINNGAVVLNEKGIIFVGPMDELPEFKDATILDAEGRLVTPGLVNAHMHFYSAPACGLGFRPAGDFKGILENLWWRLDAAMDMPDVEAAAWIFGLRSIMQGVTTVFDHHASYGAIRGSLPAIAGVVKRIGLRTALAFEVSNRAGEAAANQAIDENTDAAKAFADDPEITVLMGLHASFTLDDKTLNRAIEQARGLGMGVHVHVAEGQADVQHAKMQGYSGVVDRLNRFDALGTDTIAAHCIHINHEELHTLRDTGTWVVSNPTSNLNNGVGIAQIRKMAIEDLLVGLGTDGIACGMLAELRNLIFSQHHLMGHPTAYFADGVAALTRQNPALATHFFARDIGVLRPDAVGDAVIWDYLPATPVNADNIGGHMAFGAWESRPLTVIANGRIKVKNGRLVDWDMREISKKAKKLAEELWGRW